jgi:mono/diheme cytochrome c family protein/peroxiredoxin
MSSPSSSAAPTMSWRIQLLRALGWFILTACVVGSSAWLGRTLRPKERPDASRESGQVANELGTNGATMGSHSHGSAKLGADLETGELLYRVHCLKCHGPEGHGDPEAIERLTPPPRDFALRPWRFEVTDASIRRVIRDGIPQTAMPAARDYFTSQEMDSLVQFVLQLAREPLGGSAEQATAARATPSSNSLTSRPTTQPTGTAIHRSTRSSLLDELQSFGFRAVQEAGLAPELRLVDARGRDTRLSELRGQWVLVNFWGIDCVPCLQSLPALAELAQPDRESNLVVLSICANETDEVSVVNVAREIAPRLPVYVDQTGLACLHYDVQSLPQYWLIDPQGQRVARASGSIDWKKLSLPQHLSNKP